MSALTSVALSALTEAQPERVWEALTATGIPLPYLQGLTVESDWQPGSTVTMRLDGSRSAHGEGPSGEVVRGEVLAAEPPHRLSYTLGDWPADPSVYVTWQLHSREGSTVVYLFADEPAPYAGSDDDLELTWLRIVSALVKHLDGTGILPLSAQEGR